MDEGTHDNQGDAEKRANIQKEMDEMIKKHDAERVKHHEESVMPSAPKGNKGGIVAVVVILVLAVLGLIGYIILDKTVWNKSSSSQGQSQSQIDAPDEVVVSEITDSNIKSELDKESSILFTLYLPDKDYDWSNVVASSMYNYVDQLMTDGQLSDEAKVYVTLRALQDYEEAFTKVTSSDYTESEAKAIMAESTMQNQPASEFFSYVTKVDADDVAKLYKDIFGEDIKHQSAKEICGGYYYNADKGLYLKGLYDGCGGASPISYNLYREKYESAGDKAYMYFRVGTVNCAYDSTTCDYYSGFLSYDDAQKATPLGSVTASGTYFDNNGRAKSIVTTENFEQFAPYRIVFDKQDDGSYTFEKVEKL